MKGKKYDYIITLKPFDYKLTNTISIILCLFTMCFFVYFLIHNELETATYIVTILVIIAQLVYNYFRKKQGKIINHSYAFSVCFVAWLTIPYSNWLLAAMYFVSLLLETQVKFPFEIGVNEDGITIKAFPKKYFSWANFVNVIIRDNMLTMDFKNNRILQQETEDDVPFDLQDEFNAFCKRQLSNIAHVS